MNATHPTFYHFGDKAEYTGKSEMMHGALFYEAKWLEGHRKGKAFHTQRKPEDAK